MATQQDVIKKFMKVLDTTTAKGESALNEAISAVTNFATYAKFRAQLLSDCKAVNNADTFLQKYCGIILDNDDTGAITGSDAGGSTTKTAKSVVPEDTELIDFTGNEFTINGLTVKLADADSKGNIKSARTFDDLSEHEKYLWQSVYTWWISGGLDLIAESYGDNYSFGSKSSAVTKTLWIVFANEGSGTLAVTWGGPGYAKECTSDLQLHINTYYYGKATGVDGDPKNGQKYLDRVIAHELTHAVMRANINYFDYLPGFIKEGMAELTHGIDDARTASIKTLAGNSTKLGQALSTSAGTVNVTGAPAASYAGGYIFLRYLARQNADLTVTNSTASTSVKTFYGNDTITNSASNVTISAGTGDDSIIGGGTKNLYVYTSGNDIIENFGTTDTLSIASEFFRKKSGDDMLFVTDNGTVTLTGAANLSTLNARGNEIDDPDGNRLTVKDSTKSPVTINVAIEIVDASNRTKAVKITGNSQNNTITGGSGNDTLDGGKGDDVLTGGNGADIFILSAGDDTITDYGTGADKISIGSAQVKNFGADGDDFVFGFGDNSLTLTDAATKKISVISGKVTNIFSTDGIFNSAGTAVTLNASTEKFTADTKIVTIDAGLTTEATIIGNAKANTIIGSSDGQTTLTGGAGNDLFINTGGEDFITDYGNGSDKISLGSSLKNFSVTNGNVELELATGSVTIANGSGKKISLMSGGKTTTNIFTEGGILNAAGTAVTLNASTENYIADTNVVTIDAGLTSGATVTGNTKANKVIFDGSGGNGFIWQAKGGNDTLENFGTDSTLKISGTVTDAATSGKNSVINIGSTKITVKDSSQVTFTDDGGTKIFSGGIFYDEEKTSATLTTAINSYTAKGDIVSVTGNAKNNTLIGSADETTLTGGAGNDLFINTGGEDFITDYGNGSDKISLGSSLESFSVTDGNVELNLAKGSVTIANGDGKKISLVSGGKTTANIFTEGGILNAAGTAVTLNATTENYTAGTNVVTIDASLTKNATVTDNAKSNKVTFGSGENVFVWSKGNDTLENFGADDTLKVSGTVTDGSVKSGISYLKVGSSKITVKDSAVNIDDGDDTVIFDGGLFFDKNKTSATLGSAVTNYTVASGVTNVTGNTKANKLTANDDGDTLIGGKGNDSLWGGDGADTFIYNKGDGKDFIFGFDDTDMLEIIGLSGNVTGSVNKAGTELTVKVGSTAVAVLKEYTATSFNINDSAYHIDGKTLTK